MNPSSLFSLTEHLERLSKDGDPLEVLDATVDFEYFRGWLVEGLGYGNGSKGGRPPFDPVSIFKALILPLPGRRLRSTTPRGRSSTISQTHGWNS